MQTYRDTLKSAFDARRKKNPAYSLRSFASDLEVGASTLSEVLNHKKNLARKTGVKILKSLSLNRHERDLFLLSIDHENPSVAHSRKDIEGKIESYVSSSSAHVNQDSQQDLISDPLYATLLALMTVENFRYSLPWISNLLGIFQHETTRLFKRLHDIGSIRLNGEENPQILRNFILSPDGATFESIKAYHHNTLRRASVALDNVPRTERDFCSTILAIDPDDFENIQEDIRAFHRTLFKKYGSRKKAKRVYSLQNQFIPMTSRNESKK